MYRRTCTGTQLLLLLIIILIRSSRKKSLPDPVASLAGGLSGDAEQSSAILSESAIQTPSYIIHKEEAEGGREKVAGSTATWTCHRCWGVSFDLRKKRWLKNN